MAHDDGVLAPSGGLRGQRLQLQLCGFEGDTGVCPEHSNSGVGAKSSGLRQCLRVSQGQVHGIRRHSVPGTLVTAPLIAECFANLGFRVADTRLMNRYNFSVLEVLKAWINPAVRDSRTLHHRGHGPFMIAGESIKLPSKMK